MKELEGVTILVAEDDYGILSLLQTFFEDHGATVYPEENGRDVLEHIAKFRPDVVLLDVVMPHADGFSLLTDLRKSGDSTPVIMLTQKSMVEDKIKGLEHGADDYVAKPFSTKELLSRVKSLLRRMETMRVAEKEEISAFGNVQINLLSREILVGGKALPLTKTEFDLLSFLVNRKGVVVSHADLLNDVLGYKNPVETKALVMHIANVRKKLAMAGVVGGKIETVAGVGYMFKEEK